MFKLSFLLILVSLSSPKHSNPKLVSTSLAPVWIFSGLCFSMRFVEEDTDARGVWVLLTIVDSRGPPLARPFGWFVGGSGGGGCVSTGVGVDPTAEPRDTLDSAETFNGWRAARPGRGPGFGGGKCFNILSLYGCGVGRTVASPLLRVGWV